MKTFTLKEDSLIFYPRRVDYLASGILLFLLLLMMTIPITIEATKQGIEISVLAIILLIALHIIIPVLFITYGFTYKVVMDMKTEQVIQKSLFRSKLLAKFSDINSIRLTDRTSVYVTSYIYELEFNKNIFQDGIILTSKMRKKSKKLHLFTETVVPIVEQLIDNRSDKNLSLNNIARGENNIQLFKEVRPDCYAYKQKPIFVLIIAFVFFLIFIATFTHSKQGEYYYLIPLAMSLLLFFGYNNETVINNRKKVIIEHYFFLKKEYEFNNFGEIVIEKQTSNGKYNHCNINIRRNKRKAPYQILICQEKDVDKIPILINDIEILLNRKTNI